MLYDDRQYQQECKNKEMFDKHIEELRTDRLKNFPILDHIRKLECDLEKKEKELLKIRECLSSFAHLLNPYISHKGPTIYG